MNHINLTLRNTTNALVNGAREPARPPFRLATMHRRHHCPLSMMRHCVGSNMFAFLAAVVTASLVQACFLASVVTNQMTDNASLSIRCTLVWLKTQTDGLTTAQLKNRPHDGRPQHKSKLHGFGCRTSGDRQTASCHSRTDATYQNNKPGFTSQGQATSKLGIKIIGQDRRQSVKAESA